MTTTSQLQYNPVTRFFLERSYYSRTFVLPDPKDSDLIAVIRAIIRTAIVIPAVLYTYECLEYLCLKFYDRYFLYVKESPTATFKMGEYCAKQWNPLPKRISELIEGKSYVEVKKSSDPNFIAPPQKEDLTYMQLSHYDLHGRVRMGEILIHKNLADEIRDIFLDLFKAKYPIEKMRLIDHYDANDDKAMEDNNSSALCIRLITGDRVRYSLHSYGGAIDINTRLNPYVKGDTVLPKNGKKYLNRTLKVPGLITIGDPCYTAFTSRGYEWGGNWNSLKDYQHFQKNPEMFIT